MIFQAITTFGTNILLYALVQGLNNALAPIGLSIYLGGLLVAFPSLYLPSIHALTIIVLSAFIIDAPLLMPFGTTALLFSVGFYAATKAQPHIHYPLKTLTLTIAFTLNIFFFIGTTLFAPDTSLRNTNQLQSLLVNLVFSQIILIITAFWFFNLQQLLLSWTRTSSCSRS